MHESQEMKDSSTLFGFPNTLPPLGRRELRSCFVFAGMGLLVLMLGLFPNLRPAPGAALPFYPWFFACWLSLSGGYSVLSRASIVQIFRNAKDMYLARGPRSGFSRLSWLASASASFFGLGTLV